jgi:hypothetical protein
MEVRPMKLFTIQDGIDIPDCVIYWFKEHPPAHVTKIRLECVCGAVHVEERQVPPPESGR